jgi:protein-S-isoprenylcysteine O-methyltransferase Ste14
MPPPLIHLGGLLMGYGLDQALDWSFAVPPRLYALASSLVIAGATIAAVALFTLIHHRTTFLPHRAARTLVTSGIFRFSRNPIYLAFALLHLGCGLGLGSPGMLLMLLPVLYVMDRHVIAAEEVFHARRFGEEWQRYRERVRRWI